MFEEIKKPKLEKLLEIIESYAQISVQEKELIKKAYEISQSNHANQKRKTGEPYFIHPFNTAITLAQWNLDTPTIIAGLLHDTIEDTNYKIETLRKDFDEEIAFLVSGVTKLGKLKYRGIKSEEEKIKHMAENLRKMILAISQDLRVIFIKLADRLHNMHTLKAVPAQKQKRIALETADIYAPLAYRLGMQSLAGELEDLAFPYLYPEEYNWMIKNVGEKYESRVSYLEKVKPILEESLAQNHINPINIDYRAKRVSSLYKKLLKQEMNLEQIYDLVALRVIVNTIEECYAALGIVHQLWPPLPGRIKDYIALPKPNGYRSLHTTVFCLDNKITEIQIRTLQMHEEAEHGIAAHWAYSQNKNTSDYQKGVSSFADTKELKWVQQLKNWQKEFINPQEFVSSLKIDFFKDRVFAITPKGEVIDLPAGSTPIDFAYQIHSAVGDHCVGAKANNKIVTLDYRIQSGDMLEILVQKNKKPSTSWLKFVKTSQARNRIKNSLKKDPSSALKKQQTELRIISSDRIGLIKDITTTISKFKINIINISNINVSKGNNLPTIKIILDLHDKEKLEKLLLKIKSIDGVREISYKLI